MSYQKLIIQGNLTKDPEIRVTKDGKSIAKFCVAVNALKKEDMAEFFNCVAFNKTAEIINEHCSKGKSVIVEGKIKTNKYTDEQGVKKEYKEVTVDVFKMLGSKGIPDQPEVDPKQYEQDAMTDGRYPDPESDIQF